jgi:N6-adenosine-specific RNA methylase IME4
MIFESFDAIPRGHYGVVNADPPWNFKTYSAKGQGRSACRHYRTLPFSEIAAFPVHELAAKDCVLILWVVSSHLPTRRVELQPVGRLFLRR